MASRSGGNGRREYQRHGLYEAKRILSEYGKRAIDGRSATGRELARWIADVVADLGGEEALSAAQKTIIERAAIKRLLVNGIEAYLAEQLEKRGVGALINKRDRHAYRIVRDYAQLAESLARDLERLGLEKRKPPPEDLTAYLEREYGEG
jgi:hypothetical protein